MQVDPQYLASEHLYCLSLSEDTLYRQRSSLPFHLGLSLDGALILLLGRGRSHEMTRKCSKVRRPASLPAGNDFKDKEMKEEEEEDKLCLRKLCLNKHHLVHVQLIYLKISEGFYANM